MSIELLVRLCSIFFWISVGGVLVESLFLFTFTTLFPQVDASPFMEGLLLFGFAGLWNYYWGRRFEDRLTK